MAYDKHIWVDGELITADKLNHIEDGLSGSSYSHILNIIEVDDTLTCDESYDDIVAYITAGAYVLASYNGYLYPLTYHAEDMLAFHISYVDVISQLLHVKQLTCVKAVDELSTDTWTQDDAIYTLTPYIPPEPAQ